MLAFRGILSVAILAVGAIVDVRMLQSVHIGGWGVLPGLVLGTAMIALGVHRLSLILRVLRERKG